MINQKFRVTYSCTSSLHLNRLSYVIMIRKVQSVFSLRSNIMVRKVLSINIPDAQP